MLNGSNFSQHLLEICKGGRPQLLEAAVKSYLESTLAARSILPDHPQYEAEALILYAEYCLIHGAEVNYREPITGDTPLIHAAQKGNSTLVQLLLQHGADKNKGNFKGLTPLHAGCGQSNSEVVKVLLEHDADISNQLSTGEFPLHLAVQYPANVGLLIKFACPLNLRTPTNHTALHFAVLGRAPAATVALLLEHGANTTIKNTSGETPLMLAQRDPLLTEHQRLLAAKDAELQLISTQHSSEAKRQFLLGMYDRHCSFQQPTTSIPFEITKEICDKVKHLDFSEIAGEELFYPNGKLKC